MRILYIVPELHLGGAERQLLIVARELRTKGHAVRVLVLHPPRRPIPLGPGEDIRTLNEANAHHPRCWGIFRREIRDFRPEVVHTFLFGFDLWANLAARWRRVPAVVSSRREVPDWQRWHHRWWQNLGNLFADAVVANSRAVADYCARRERFMRPAAFHVVPNAYEKRPAETGSATPLPPRGAGPLLVNVANFWPGKGHEVLVPAFRRVLDRHPDAALWLVGEGPRMAAARALAAESPATHGRVHFLGRRHDIDRILAGATLYVHASFMESSPNAILEAMGAGVPVVATAVGGVPELLEDGRLGRLCPPRDPQALADAILEALAAQDATPARRDAALAATASRHAPEESARGFERVYLGLLSRK